MAHKPTPAKPRKPPSPDPKAVEAFVKEGSTVPLDTQTSKSLDVPLEVQQEVTTSGSLDVPSKVQQEGKTLESSAVPLTAPPNLSPSSQPPSQPSQVALRAPGATSQIARKDGTVRRKMTLYLPPDLARELAVYCAGNGLEISATVSVAVAEYLKRQSEG
jgi:hypothetical protein